MRFEFLSKATKAKATGHARRSFVAALGVTRG